MTEAEARRRLRDMLRQGMRATGHGMLAETISDAELDACIEVQFDAHGTPKYRLRRPDLPSSKPPP